MCDFSADGSFLNCGYWADRQSVLSLDTGLRNAVQKLGWYSQNCVRVLDLLTKMSTRFSPISTRADVFAEIHYCEGSALPGEIFLIFSVDLKSLLTCFLSFSGATTTAISTTVAAPETSNTAVGVILGILAVVLFVAVLLFFVYRRMRTPRAPSKKIAFIHTWYIMVCFSLSTLYGIRS